MSKIFDKLSPTLPPSCCDAPRACSFSARRAIRQSGGGLIVGNTVLEARALRGSFAGRYIIGILCFVAMLLSSCQPGTSNEQGNLLARVHNKSLHLSDLEGMLPMGSTSEDSTLIIQAFVERWVRDAVMLHEAERNVPKDLNIDKLVRDYRASLVQHTYEKVLVDQLLDSTVTQTELASFYEANKEQFYLNHDIVRVRFVKLPRSTPEVNQFEKWWVGDSREDFLEMVNYCEDFAIKFVLNDSLWIRVNDIFSYFPEGAVNESQLLSQNSLKRQDELYRCYYQRLETLNEGEIAPLSFIADQARKVILHKRKMRLLHETRENMYERALRHNEVKIYIQ